jgi:hypothetical protein
MSTMSLYVFERSGAERAGPYWENHVTHGPEAWAWNTIFNLPDTHSALCWERPNNEDVLDLSAAANNPIALTTIDSMLTGSVSRRGAIRTSYVTWGNMPSQVTSANPGRHQPWELLATINVDFHVSTPWYCSDADGTIRYYVFFFLDSGGNLRSQIEGWYYSYSGGGPFCTGAISSGLNSAVPAGIAPLQNLLNATLPLFARGRTFNMMYYLPGHGSRSGFTGDNADNNVALAVLPNN